MHGLDCRLMSRTRFRWIARQRRATPRPSRGHQGLRFLAALVLAWCVGGCAGVGPGTLMRDRFDYGAAVGDSWKQQTLLNIVKLRYMDLPVFLDVAQIVSGYTVESTVRGSTNLYGPGGVDYVALGAEGKYIDRPTITYTPMMGDQFLRSMMMPVDPKTIFYLLQTGYAADFILGLTVESINGLQNRPVTPGSDRKADADFVRVLMLIRDLQSSGVVSMRVETDKDRRETGVVFFRSENLPPEVLEKCFEVRRLLGLSPTKDRFRIVYSPVRGTDDELCVNSRSMLQMMAAIASCVDVPESDVHEGRAIPGLPVSTDAPVRIHSGTDRPSQAYMAVHYRRRWFWIEDRDWRSKRALMAVMFFFTLSEGNDQRRLPLITIPAG